MEQITRKQVQLIGSAPTYEGLESLIKEKMYWKEVKTEPSTRFSARWHGTTYDVFNAKGLVSSMIIVECKGRWCLYSIK